MIILLYDRKAWSFYNNFLLKINKMLPLYSTSVICFSRDLTYYHILQVGTKCTLCFSLRIVQFAIATLQIANNIRSIQLYVINTLGDASSFSLRAVAVIIMYVHYPVVFTLLRCTMVHAADIDQQ